MTIAAQPPRLESIRLDVDGLAIAGIRHRSPRSNASGASHASADPHLPALVCLHGWLDNAASFLPLMPHLPGVDLIAIDLPGHGHSGHLPEAARTGYGLFDSAIIVRRVIGALGLARCHLAGHSMGGAIAPMLACAAPETIDSLILIESSGPLSEEADALPARFARAFDDRRAHERYASRTFATTDEAIDARLKATRMARTSAKLVIDRQLIACEGGYRWRFDPALRYASAQYQTRAQVLSVFDAIAQPTLTVVADEGFLAGRPDTESRLERLRARTAVSLSGHHHVHMDSPEPVAAAINRFLGTRPALGG